MCERCYDEKGRPFVPGPEVDEAVRMVRDLYEFASAGGGMHIVTDDDNVEDRHIRWCLENLHENSSTSPAERAIEAAVGLHFLALTVDQRYTVLALFWGY